MTARCINLHFTYLLTICVTRCLFNINNFATSAPLVEVRALLSVVLVLSRSVRSTGRSRVCFVQRPECCLWYVSAGHTASLQTYPG